MTTRYWYWLWKTFLGPSRLRRKFVRTFLISGLVPLLVMGAVSYYLVNYTHQLDVLRVEDNLSLQVSNEIQNIFDVTKSSFDVNVPFDNFAQIALTDQDFILQGLIKGIPELSQVSFICVTPDLCTVGQETNRYSNINQTTQKEFFLRDRRRDEAFKEASAGKIFIGDPYFVNATATIPIASPVLNKSGQIVDVLSGEMDLNAVISPIVASTKLGTTGYVYAVSPDGKIIAHPNPALIGTSLQSFPFRNISSATGTITNASYMSATGVAVSGAAHLMEEGHIIVVAEWPQAETQSLIRTILLQIGGFSAFAIILLIIISSWVALRLIQPIAELRQGTSVIGAGNFNYRVNIKTGDELEDLGTNLNKMASNLKGLEEVRELRLRTDLLSESLRKEQELSKLKDQFITTVSHQFNTPLAAINWALAAFNDPTLDKKKTEEAVSIVSKSQKDIVAIVNDLVTLSEVGFQYKKTKIAPVDVAAVIDKILDFLSSTIKVKKVLVSFKKTTTNTTAQINEFTIAKAIENLIDNAIGYSNEGGEVTIELGGDDKQIHLIVTDRGIGIPLEDQPQIFQQFFRARNAIKKKNVGTGLGLYIVKTIIEGHGGKVWFESVENNGSSFHVTLPR